MRLALREVGDPQGRAVVLLHAFPVSGSMWQPQLEALSGFRVLIPDFRGFGSTPLIDPWLIEHAACDVLETVPGSAAFVGLSMGGYVAMAIAREAPQRVDALVLCDTRAEPDTNETKAKRAASIDFIRSHGIDAFSELFFKDSVAQPRVRQTLRDMASKTSASAAMAALSALAARPDAMPGLSKIRVPTAVFVGAQDTITPLPLAETIRSRVAGAELHIIADAGHFSNMENPAAFNERLTAFLRRLTHG
ncbi:MAG: alpha/beta fold hydrolase [Elusimicrobiota bacterium]